MNPIVFHRPPFVSTTAPLVLRSSPVLPAATRFPSACVHVTSRPAKNRPVWGLCALLVWVTLKASAQLALILPNSAVEGIGVLTNGGRVVLSAMATSNTFVSLV